MITTKLKFGMAALAVAGAATVLVMQNQAQEKLRAENGTLRQQLAQPQSRPEPAVQATAAEDPKPLPEDQFRELLRLRGEVTALRQQTNDLTTRLANSQAPQAQTVCATVQQPGASASPEDYPKTADGAAKGICDTFLKGDWDTFFANFAQPGVPREHYEKLFQSPRVSNYLASIESMSLGQPTNIFGQKWAVPYKMQFKDGSEKEWQLYVVQNPKTQRWYFDGGF